MILVERDSQKGIIIGKQGALLKKIGKMARRDIEIMLGDKVYLETWVKVKKNWRDKKCATEYPISRKYSAIVMPV